MDCKHNIPLGNCCMTFPVNSKINSFDQFCKEMEGLELDELVQKLIELCINSDDLNISQEARILKAICIIIGVRDELIRGEINVSTN